MPRRVTDASDDGGPAPPGAAAPAGAGADPAFEGLAALAAALLDAPFALVVLADGEGVWASPPDGRPGGPRGAAAGVPLAERVIASRSSVVVEDARLGAGADADGRAPPVGAWVGVPVRPADGPVLGALCVVDAGPRAWTEHDVQVLGALADTARAEAQLRGALDDSRSAIATLERMQEASSALLAALTFDDIADVVLDEAVGVLGARAANLALLAPSGRRFAASRSTGFPEAVARRLEGMEIGDSFLSGEAARTGRPVWMSGEDWRRLYPGSRALVSGIATEAAAIPLAVGGHLLGILGLIFDSPGRRRSPAERGLAHALADQCAQALERGRLYDRERRTAEVLQRSLLPGRLPEIPELDVAARYVPSGEGSRVGGDFYDLFPIEPGTWGAVVGDVCGKGPEAAAMTAQARHLIRAHARIGRGPAEILRNLNAAMLEDRRPFLTAAAMRLSASADAVEGVVCLGGHMPPLALRADGSVEPLGRPGTLIGVLEHPNLHEAPFALAPGDALLLFTDGVTEARRDGVQLGPDGLADVLAGCAGLDAEAIAACVIAAVGDRDGARGADDIVVLVIRRR